MDDRDLYSDTADADYPDDTLVPPPPRMTPSEFRERQERLRAEWAALTQQDDNEDDETLGTLIREAPLADEPVGRTKESTHE